MRTAQRAEGPATVLAIGTANPDNYIFQAEYPDYYFRVTNSEHMTELKAKFKRICERTMIQKRHMHLTEDILKDNPSLCSQVKSSIDARQDIAIAAVPKLGMAAALVAIKEWNRPKSEITHLIFCSTSGVDMPGADYQLVKFLGLSSSVKRLMIYQQGDRTMIQKRHMHLTEDMLKENPSLCSQVESSLDARQAISIAEVPKLGKAASLAAIKEWDRPKHDITHLVFCSTSGVDMPGADYQLVKLLGLRPSVKRLMIYQQGCYTGGSALRIAKDLAENNRGSRILLVCSEVTAVMFRGLPEANLDDIMVGDGPSQIQMDTLVSQALFGDGAAALIIGSDPDLSVEKPIFQIAYATQTILPGSEGCIEGHLTEVGLSYTVKKEVPMIISKNIGKSLEEALAPLGIQEDWNSLFWITHPGGPAILDKVEQTLGLEEERMRATRKVLSEYGNMWGATALFIMDKMRKMSMKEGKSTTGDGMEWGVLLGFGPGITVETVILKSVPI